MLDTTARGELNGESEVSTEQQTLAIICATVGALVSIGMMNVSGHIHARDALASGSRKIRELRNQFQEFCASIRESGSRRVCCTDTPCSISKESITRFFTYAGLAGAVVVGTGLIGIAPYRDAMNCADSVTYLSSRALLKLNGDSISQQTQDVIWWTHFAGAYVCNIIVPLVFMTRVFSGLKQDVMEFFGGARYRNEHVQDTVHNLRALLARLSQDNDLEQFTENLMHQKYIGSPELMLMDYASTVSYTHLTLPTKVNV